MTWYIHTTAMIAYIQSHCSVSPISITSFFSTLGMGSPDNSLSTSSSSSLSDSNSSSHTEYTAHVPVLSSCTELDNCSASLKCTKNEIAQDQPQQVTYEVLMQVQQTLVHKELTIMTEKPQVPVYTLKNTAACHTLFLLKTNIKL